MCGARRGTMVYHPCIRGLVTREHFRSMNGADICNMAEMLSAWEQCAMKVDKVNGNKGGNVWEGRTERNVKSPAKCVQHSLSSVSSFLERMKEAPKLFLEDFALCLHLKHFTTCIL